MDDAVVCSNEPIEEKSLYQESQIIESHESDDDDDMISDDTSDGSDTQSLDINPRSRSQDLEDGQTTFLDDKELNLAATRLKKIFLISHYLDYSGAPQVLYLLYNYLKERRYEVYLISQRGISPDIKDNRQIIPPNHLVRPQNLLKFINRECVGTSVSASDHLSSGIECIYRFQPIIFCNTLLSHVYVKEALKQNLPIYWIVHESIKPYLQLVKKHIIHLMPKVTGMIYVCEASRSSYSKIKQNHADVIFNSLNLEKMDTRIEEAKRYRVPNKSLLTGEEFLNFRGLKGAEKLRKLQDISNKKELWEKSGPTIGPITGPSRIFLEDEFESKKKDILIITIVGLICDNKNQMGFIKEVFEPLSKEFDHIRLLLLGNVSDETVGKTIENDKVTYQGLVDNVIPYLLISDIVVCYSKFEVFPMSLLEAMYCAKPIVAVYRGGIGEMLDSGNSGFLIKNSSQALNRLSLLIGDEEKRKTMGIRGREIIKERFSLQRNFSKYIELINRSFTGPLD